AERHRGQGYRPRLVDAFVDRARSRGCTEVWVLTDPDHEAALGTYESSGELRDATPQVMFTWHLADGNHS
ncbi:MAG: GNAT family N-acetyltransferase, partial [Acidimicrobiales bacterium]